MKLQRLCVQWLSTALLAGCGEPSIDDRACKAFQEGPFSSINAASPGNVVPTVKDDDRRYDITLAEVTGGRGGIVSFKPVMNDHYALFLSADVPVEILRTNGQPALIEDGDTRFDECEEIKVRHIALMVGGLEHDIHFGPTSETVLSLAIERAPDVFDD
jgi:hypothetical protein